MKISRLKDCISCLLLLLCVNSKILATVLTFDAFDSATGTRIAGSTNWAWGQTGDVGFHLYGDRVTSTEQLNRWVTGYDKNYDFEYGSAGGWTPNVEVSYIPYPEGQAAGMIITAQNIGWPIENSLILVPTGTWKTSICEFHLKADAGYQVNLASFDIAAPVAYNINSVTILDGDDNAIEQISNAYIDTLGNGGTHFSSDSWVAQTVKIRIDLANAPADWNYKLLLDNVAFSQSEKRFKCGDIGTVYLPGDINKDCYVDFIDFAKLAINWLQCNHPQDNNCGW